MDETLVVIYDACVFYPPPLRDLLMQLALSKGDMPSTFRAQWTHLTHEEWIENLLKNRPDLSRVQLKKTCDKINKEVDGIVENFEQLIPELKLPDPDDRHVLAAAIVAKASIIVTYNLKDFPSHVLDGYGIEAMHPDDFIMLVAENDHHIILEAVKEIRSRLKNPPQNTSQYLDTLSKQGLPQTIEFLRKYETLL